jgi:hypothetical protein
MCVSQTTSLSLSHFSFLWMAAVEELKILHATGPLANTVDICCSWLNGIYWFEFFSGSWCHSVDRGIGYFGSCPLLM